MIVIRPQDIVDPVIQSNGVAIAVANAIDGTPWNSGQPYAINELVHVPAEHQVYKCAQAHTNQDPTGGLNTDYWTPAYKTNDRRFMDDYSSSQTEADGPLTIQFQPSSFITGLAIFNADADYIQVTVETPTHGVIYDKTIQMVDTSAVRSLWAYFFEPQKVRTDAVFLDLPIRLNTTVTITFGGSSVAIGNVIPGQTKRIGDTEWGVGVELEDYSFRKKDEYGNWTVSLGDFSRLRSYDVQIDSDDIHDLDNFFADHLSRPLAFVGTEHNIASLNFGFFENVKQVMKGELISDLSIYVQGMR